MTKVAVIGAGLIGRSQLVSSSPAPVSGEPLGSVSAENHAGDDLHRRPFAGIAPGGTAGGRTEVLARIVPVASMFDAVQDVVHVQENGPEQVPAKQALFAELDRNAKPDVVLASSTSGIPASAFTEALPHRERCLVAHPVNPPYLVPLVELCPAPWTDANVVERTRDLMFRAGQVPATVKKEMEGFALNRLQGALLAEAFRLLADDVISPGISMRW